MAERRVVIVGASLAGLRCAQGLRAEGFDGDVTLVGAEAHLPYDRPPLSKQFLAGEWDEARIGLAPPEELTRLELDLRLGQPATGVDAGARTVTLADGEPVGFDELVIATGATPRRISPPDELEGVHQLRTLEDSRAIGASLAAGARVVVVGAGFIGSEVAAVARGKGLDVTVLEALPVPLSRGLGPILGPAVARLHDAHGTKVRCGAAVEGFDGHGHVERVRLTDGSVVDADLVVVGVGVQPATAWLEGAGLELRDGVVCDTACRALGVEHVWAVGDVARWPHELFGEELRLEHWDNAVMQGHHVAQSIVGGPSSFAPVPYVWSDQYESTVQIYGRPHGDDDVELVAGDLDGGPFLALTGRAGRLTGVVGMDQHRRAARLSRLIGDRASLDDAREAARG